MNTEYVMDVRFPLDYDKDLVDHKIIYELVLPYIPENGDIVKQFSNTGKFFDFVVVCKNFDYLLKQTIIYGITLDNFMAKNRLSKDGITLENVQQDIYYFLENDK